MQFKEKEFSKRPLFIRQEAALANLSKTMKSEDVEVKADAMIKAMMLRTTLDLAFLESLNIDEFIELQNLVNPPPASPKETPAPEASPAT